MKAYSVRTDGGHYEGDAVQYYFPSKAKALSWLKRYRRAVFKERLADKIEQAEEFEADWANDQGAASECVAKLKSQGPEPIEPDDVMAHVIPTDKAGLLAWLNNTRRGVEPIAKGKHHGNQ